MHLDFAETLTAQGCQAVQLVGIVLLERIEKRVSRRSAIAVAELAKQVRVFSNPALDASQGDGRCGLMPRLASSAGFENTRTCLASSATAMRSEEHTSELPSHLNLVCRLL